jgi:hypothetical protein
MVEIINKQLDVSLSSKIDWVLISEEMNTLTSTIKWNPEDCQRIWKWIVSTLISLINSSTVSSNCL